MKPADSDRNSALARVGDAIANSLESMLVARTCLLCRWFAVTPETIRKHQVAAYGNKPAAIERRGITAVGH